MPTGIPCGDHCTCQHSVDDTSHLGASHLMWHAAGLDSG